MAKMKSFRGLLADGGIDTIPLHTNNGSTGYKITKLEIMPNTPGAASAEFIMQVFTVKPDAASATVDFSNQECIGAAYLTDRSDNTKAPETIVFDSLKFNQDIYVTLVTNESNNACNYHIELEQVKLSLDENTVATLKDIRNIKG
jgi:hypothetical protein